MFGKKKIFIDKQFGNLEYYQGYWSGCTVIGQFQECIVELAGDKNSPNPVSLEQGKKITTDINYFINSSVEFIQQKNINEFIEGNGDLVFGGFCTNETPGSFDIQFSLSNWEDASIVVHFENNKPVEISQGD